MILIGLLLNQKTIRTVKHLILLRKRSRGEDNKALMDLKSNALNHVNTYKFHNPPILEVNVIKHKEARTFRAAVNHRVSKHWINLEINRMIMYQYNTLKVRTRDDKILYWQSWRWWWAKVRRSQNQTDLLCSYRIHDWVPSYSSMGRPPLEEVTCRRYKYKDYLQVWQLKGNEERRKETS